MNFDNFFVLIFFFENKSIFQEILKPRQIHQHYRLGLWILLFDFRNVPAERQKPGPAKQRGHAVPHFELVRREPAPPPGIGSIFQQTEERRGHPQRNHARWASGAGEDRPSL